MWARKVRDAFMIEMSLETVFGISVGSEGKCITQGVDTEKLEVCSGA